MISLGSYKLDVKEMLLSRNGERVILEPKVLEVLLYFIDNTGRYITMDELHENLWQGRVVSDAAVRRIISKLRILFNDDHKSPNYIKSLPKRGYKLICSVSHNEDIYVANPKPTFPKNKTGSVTLDENIASSKPAILLSKKKKYLTVLSTLIFLFFITIITQFQSVNTQTPQIVSTKVIKSLPGEKRSVAQSPDGDYLAFSGKVSDSPGFQIYIKHESEKDFYPLTHTASFPSSIVFSSNNKALFFLDNKKGKFSINKIDLTKSEKVVEELLNDYVVIADIFNSPNNNDVIYFSGRKKTEEPIFIYSFNLKTAEVEQITTGSQQQFQDLVGSISPNGKKIAILRYFEFENRNEIRIVNLSSKEILYRRHQDDNVYDIQWLSDTSLLLLDDKQLLKINYEKNREYKLLSENHNIWYMAVTSSRHVLAVRNKKRSKIFFEQKLPLNIFTTQEILNVENSTYALKYQTNKSEKLALTNNGNSTIFGKMNTNSNKFSSYIETEYELVAMDSSSTGQLELIKINHRFALFNTNTKIIDYITSADEFIGDATFSNNEQSILFTVRNYDQWIVKRYDISTKTTEVLFEGYRFVRAYGDNYILGTPSGDLFLYNNTTNQRSDLNHALSLDNNTRWDVRKSASEGNIYWSSHDLLQTTFHQLNIKDLNNMLKSEQKFNYSKVRPFFSINNEGTRLLYGQQPANKANIVLLSLPQS